jgi:glycosyltransferase involved in cell wall biosynthesis
MPTIATRHSDIPYTFGPFADQLIPERDAGAIAERLEQYLDEPDRLTLDGLALREHILSSFDLRVCAPRLSDLYDQVGRG